MLKPQTVETSILCNFYIDLTHINEESHRYKEIDSVTVKNKDPSSSSAHSQVCLCYPDGLVWPLSASVPSDKLGGEN